MKKVCCALLAAIMAFSLAACGQSAVSSSQSQQSASGSEAKVSSFSAKSSSPGSTSAESSASGQEEQVSEPESTNGTLVVYFSASGNIEAVAETLADALEADIYELVPEEPYMDDDLNWNDPDSGADIFRIEPVTPYPTDHDTLVDQAVEEQEQNTRPAIAGQVDNMADYDVIYLGYPNWWGDMPMILYTFLEQYDLSGKTIVPFNTHGGSGFSGTIGTIRELEPDAQVLDGLSISRNDIQDAQQEIVDWVSGLDIAP